MNGRVRGTAPESRAVRGRRDFYEIRALFGPRSEKNGDRGRLECVLLIFSSVLAPTIGEIHLLSDSDVGMMEMTVLLGDFDDRSSDERWRLQRWIRTETA